VPERLAVSRREAAGFGGRVVRELQNLSDWAVEACLWVRALTATRPKLRPLDCWCVCAVPHRLGLVRPQRARCAREAARTADSLEKALLSWVIDSTLQHFRDSAGLDSVVELGSCEGGG
jgi:hypothetical protein